VKKKKLKYFEVIGFFLREVKKKRKKKRGGKKMIATRCQ
jgi:hypothetical protein